MGVEGYPEFWGTVDSTGGLLGGHGEEALSVQEGPVPQHSEKGFLRTRSVVNTLSLGALRALYSPAPS